MSPAGILAQIDKQGASFRSADDAARLAVLAGSQALLAGAGDLAFMLALAPSVLAQPNLASADLLNKGIYSAFFAALDGYFQSNTAALLFGTKAVTSLDLYASFQNAATIDSFLIDPNSARLYFLSRQSAAGTLLTPSNVFAPLTTFGAATVGAGAALVYGPGPAPNSIPTANVGTAQGYTPSKGLQATVTAAIGGTLTVTVTATGRTAAGAFVAGRTWAGILDNAAAGAVINFTPAVAGDRIASITGVAGTGSAGSGGFSLQSMIERVAS